MWPFALSDFVSSFSISLPCLQVRDMAGFTIFWLLLMHCLRSVSLEAEPETGFEYIIFYESALWRKAMKEAGQNREGS